MTKLICLRGWSGSGKSRKAREIAKRTGAVVVNRDSLRMMMLGTHWTGIREDEDRVTLAEEAQVAALLRAGVSTVIDATHLEPRFLRKWARLATRMGVDFEVVDVITDISECKRRAYARWREPGPDFGRYIDPGVIEKQARRHPVEKWPVVTAEPFDPKPVEWVEGLPEACVFDIDGTLAVNVGRSPYDYSRVTEDAPNENVCWLAREMFNLRYTGVGPRVFILSGRDDNCRAETEEWLSANGIEYDGLFMRPSDLRDERGGKPADFLVKYDLFEQNLRGRFNIRFVADDRLQVAELWDRMGLTLLRVGDPNANF